MKIAYSNFPNQYDSEFKHSIEKLFNASSLNYDLILFKMDRVSRENKIMLRKLISKEPDALILICSFNPKVLGFSTGVPIFHAINLLDWEHSLRGLKYRLKLMQVERPKPSLPIYYDQKTINLPFEDICCIKGSGNYCHIYVHEQQEYVVTSRIKEIRSNLEASDLFVDINRSLVINMNRVATIGKDAVTFKSKPKYKLYLGYRSLKKVRDTLLWSN